MPARARSMQSTHVGYIASTACTDRWTVRFDHPIGHFVLNRVLLLSILFESIHLVHSFMQYGHDTNLPRS